MNKGAALMLITLLAASNLILVESASAQSIPKPSVPEFNVQRVAYPYDVPTTYSTDPYTGENITHQGYHAENASIVIMIKNQHFTPYSINGSEVNLYYQVRFKGHFENDSWLLLFGSPSTYPIQSNAEYTVVPFSNLIEPVPNNAQLDIQVKALVGTVVFVNGRIIGAYDYYVFEGEESDWSETQTITFSNPLQISVMSPLAKNYSTSDVPLNFTVNNPVSQVTYSLDGQENVTIAGNTILTDLPNGMHNVTVYVNDTYGNTGKSETINFTVAVAKEPFPITLVAVASVAVVVLVGIGLLVHFKKRKRVSDRQGDRDRLTVTD